MSSHLASDWQGTRLGILAEQSSNNPGHLDQYIQGPLAQIEAARKALHSPSLVSNRSGINRVGGSMRQYSDMNKQQPGRKCLSRTQMAEPYELSQDLLDKQLEMLGSRYGGLNAANDAANTIQRAYRRYSMMKKFAAITSAAQVKNENRLSKRFQGHPGHSHPGMATPQQQQHHTVRHVPHVDAVDNVNVHHGHSHVPVPYHHNCSYNHNQTGSGSKLSPNVDFSSPAGRHFTTPNNCVTPGSGTSSGHHNNHDCHTPHCPARGLTSPWPLQTPHHHIGVRPGVSLEDDNHSDAEIQSFPIDYLPDRSALSCSSRLTGGGMMGGATGRHHHVLVPGRALGPSHAHCANCGSGQALPSHHSHRNSGKQKRAPDVPKRTVSRLTSLDVGESSELYPRPPDNRVSVSAPHSRTSSSNSSPRVPVTGAHVAHHASPQQTTTTTNSGSKTRTSQSSIPSRPKEVYHTNYAVNEVIRKRHYRTGLNIFNKKPERGVHYLIGKGFLDNSPQAVARFLMTRKGLAKQMIGEYLGNISSPFNQTVLHAFANEMDLSNMPIDLALRKFQTYFRMPGEAQKIERLMEIFSHRYVVCNPDTTGKLNSTDSIFILAFAIILLNTDLHTPNLKEEKRMKVEDFVRNLRGIDDGSDLDEEMLQGVYERIRQSEFRPGSDHVTQVMKVQQTIVSKCPNLAVPYRRLVCYCRLYEVNDPNKKDRPGQHQREVFLFNDILVITKIHSRRKNSVTYTFRGSHPLAGMMVNLFENSYYSYGITLSQRWDRKVVITLNARNDHDRSKFVEDLRESIAEMDEMEQIRIETELEKQHQVGQGRERERGDQHRDSGVGGDMGATGAGPETGHNRARHNNTQDSNLKKSAINNSLLDLSDNHSVLGYTLGGVSTRRGSVGSLDSGMSVSFQSGSAGSAGTVSQESSPQQPGSHHGHVMGHVFSRSAGRKHHISGHTGQSTQL